jgi:hypothetical protein
MADELLSNDLARITDDWVRLVKNRVLQSAHGFFETTPTSNGYASSRLILHSIENHH